MAARLFGRTLLALLVVLLQLQGYMAAGQRACTPAHFHVLVVTEGVVVTGMHPGDVLETLGPRGSVHRAANSLQTDHAHRADAVGVVYFESDAAAVPGDGWRKHVAAFDIVLPGWSMPLAAVLPALISWAAPVNFISRVGDRLLRPPRAAVTM